jgi:nucleotidyltransferase substrate binding protein (TIGR01987 family)
MTKFESVLEDFLKALERFEEVLREPKNDIVRDSAIKRFEFTFDLAWKTTKAFLEKEHNVTCVSPKTCFREAFRVGLIEYDDGWNKLVDNRNYTVHVYKEIFAEKIYRELPQALRLFQDLASAFRQNKT